MIPTQDHWPESQYFLPSFPGQNFWRRFMLRSSFRRRKEQRSSLGNSIES